MSSAVIVSLRVKATPARAFDAFTREIGAWWRPHPLFPLLARDVTRLHLEPAIDGRLLAEAADGETVEVGRVTEWTPGERVAFTWRPATFAPDQITTVQVRFEAIADETRVTVEHRGWDAIPAEHAARHRFPLDAFQMRLAEYWRALLATCAAAATR